MAKRNVLLDGISMVGERLAAFKEAVRQFYYDLLLSIYPCPACSAKMKMAGPSKCTCKCSMEFDPTVQFQQSPCCNAKLIRKTFHYACTSCGTIVPSRFLFDERVFDAAYFTEKMRSSRENKKRKLEELKQLLANTRSDTLTLTELPSLESVPGLLPALDEFVGTIESLDLNEFMGRDEFHMEEYKNGILATLGSSCRLFSAFPDICGDARLERTRRFTTLIFMEHEHEVELAQHGENDIMVMRHEADIEG